MESEENQTQVSLASHSPWKSLSRFPHSHSPGEARKSGKRKSTFPTFPLTVFCIYKTNQKGGPAADRFRSRLQAHSSMRKCFPKQNRLHDCDRKYVRGRGGGTH